MNADEREGLLVIDLQAVAENYRILQSRLSHGSRCGAVVKADAYGLGMAQLAPVLYRNGCRDFFVAIQSEGEALRRILPDDATIVVLTGVRDGCQMGCAEANIMPALYTLQQVRDWVKTCRQIGRAAPCVVKIDSGMTRLGMTAEDFSELLADRQLVHAANIHLLLSHLACADEPQHPQNAAQLQCFRNSAARLKALCPQVQLSFANSAGIHLGEPYQFDLVRPGSALYGVNPTPQLPNPMRAVVQLRLPVLQKRHLSAAQNIGYGATQSAAAGSWLAVARGGYADGILRAQSGRGCAVAAGQRVPLQGRVSMDSIVFDISSLSDAEREALEVIEVLNQQLTVDEVAGYAGTIGYEILTSLGHRYQRRYINADA